MISTMDAGPYSPDERARLEDDGYSVPRVGVVDGETVEVAFRMEFADRRRPGLDLETVLALIKARLGN